VGHRQVREIAGPEPAKVVVLLGSGVDGFPFPAPDEERVHVERGVTNRDRYESWVVDTNTEFFEAFPTDGLMR